MSKMTWLIIYSKVRIKWGKTFGDIERRKDKKKSRILINIDTTLEKRLIRILNVLYDPTVRYMIMT